MRIIRKTTYDFVGPCKAEDCKRHILTNIDLIWSFYNFICKRSLCSELEIILIIFLFTVTVFKWKNMISAIIEATFAVVKRKPEIIQAFCTQMR